MARAFQEKKDDNRIYFIIGMIVSCVLAVILFATSTDIFLGRSSDLNDLVEDGEVEKGKYIELKVDGVVGNYAETKHYTNFIPTGTDQHFIIWLDSGEFISLTTKDKKMIKELEAITESTWDYVDGYSDELSKSIVIKGTLSNMDSEIKGYYREWLVDYDIEDSAYYLTIDTSQTQASNWTTFGILCLVSIGCLFALIVTGRKPKEPAKVTYEVVNNDFDSVDSTYGGSSSSDVYSGTSYSNPVAPEQNNYSTNLNNSAPNPNNFVPNNNFNSNYSYNNNNALFGNNDMNNTNSTNNTNDYGSGIDKNTFN